MSPRTALHRPHSHSGAPRVRCPRCLSHPDACPCDVVAPLSLATRVLVYRHRKEVHKPTNTGRLVALCLANAELRTFGGQGETFDGRELDDRERITCVLFPSADALPLEALAADGRPLTLVVADADWRRANKFALREPGLAHLPRVRVPVGDRNTLRLRHHPNESFLSTFESVARALGVLEGDVVREQLEHVFRTFVERALRARGRLPALRGDDRAAES